MSVNKAILVGRLGKDPELTYTQSGTARCKFSMATSDSYLDNSGQRQEKTEWHNIVVWGKQAESAGKYLQKGREVYVEGKIETRSWDDEKTGTKRYMTEIVARQVVFIGGKGSGSSSPNQTHHSDSRSEDGRNSGGGPSGPDRYREPDDDIPF